VIEAGAEDLGLKQKLFADLATACGPEAILASNTPRCRNRDRRRDAGARARRRHALLQPAGSDGAGRGGGDQVLLRGGPRGDDRGRPPHGRTPIRAKDSPGFIANRLARPYSLESLRMLAEGVADAPTIDRALRLGGGFKMGRSS